MNTLSIRQTELSISGQNADMETPRAPRIVQAERLNGGVIISFDDGTSAMYSAALLYAALDQAQILEELEED